MGRKSSIGPGRKSSRGLLQPMPHASASMDDVGRTAIVLPPTHGDWSVAAARVGGVSLLRRILVSAQRAGVRTLIICAGDAAPRLQPPVQVPLSGAAVCLDLANTTSERAAAALYRALGKPTDSWLIRRSRRLLFPIMRALVDTRVTPNQLTLAGFFIGLGAIACLWQDDYAWTVVGGMLFVLAYLTDLLDGMLARLRLQESRWGGVMDYVLDNLVHVGIFAAIVRAVYLKRT